MGSIENHYVEEGGLRFIVEDFEGKKAEKSVESVRGENTSQLSSYLKRYLVTKS